MLVTRVVFVDGRRGEETAVPRLTKVAGRLQEVGARDRGSILSGMEGVGFQWSDESSKECWVFG